MTKTDLMTWVSGGVLAGRGVTRCQPRTGAAKRAADELDRAKPESCPKPSMDVFRGVNAAKSALYALVLRGRSQRSGAAATLCSVLASTADYEVPLFRWSPNGSWMAVLTKEDL